MYTAFDRAYDAHIGKFPKEELRGAAKHIFENYTREKLETFKEREKINHRAFYPSVNQGRYKSW